MARVVPVSPPEHVFDSLRSPVQFRRVLRRGSRRRVEGVTVVSLARARGGNPAVGLATGRGFAGAVIRNRVKRRIRHALREVSLSPATDYVVIATPQVADVGFDRLVDWLRSALEVKV